MTNRIGLPDDLKNAKQQGEFESTMRWEKTRGDLSLCTYTTKSKLKGKKNTLVLSTIEMRPLMDITRDKCDNGKQKPAIIKFYDFTKGGTDVMDQKISKYSCKLLTHRWTMIHFFFLMDTIRCNAMVLHAIKHKKPLRKSNYFDIGWALVLALVRPFMAARSAVGLGQALKNKIAIFVQKNSDKPAPISLKSVALTTKKERIT